MLGKCVKIDFKRSILLFLKYHILVVVCKNQAVLRLKMSQKPTTINTLLLKLKGESVMTDGNSDVAKVNAICDTFIAKLKTAGVKIKGYDLSISLDTGVVSKKKDVEEDVEKEPEPEPEPELCSICKDDLDDMTTTLACGHKFHHDCVIYWYTSLLTGGGCEGNKIARTCPYCRADGGYLDLHAGETYVYGVHHEKFKNGIPEPEPEPVKVSAETVVLTPIKELVKKVPVSPPPAPKKITKAKKMAKNTWQCHGMTKKGNQCKKSKLSGTNFCFIHAPDYSTKS